MTPECQSRERTAPGTLRPPRFAPNSGSPLRAQVVVEGPVEVTDFVTEFVAEEAQGSEFRGLAVRSVEFEVDARAVGLDQRQSTLNDVRRLAPSTSIFITCGGGALPLSIMLSSVMHCTSKVVSH